MGFQVQPSTVTLRSQVLDAHGTVDCFFFRPSRKKSLWSGLVRLDVFVGKALVALVYYALCVMYKYSPRSQLSFTFAVLIIHLLTQGRLFTLSLR